MNITNLQSDMEYLFNCNYFDKSFDPEGSEEHQDFAVKVLQLYQWDEIYNWFFHHLTQSCATAESSYNAINLYYCYCFDENPIPNPYELVGYILFRINLKDSWDKYGDFVDSFTTGILEKNKKVDLMADPYYQPWKDPEVIKQIESWRKQFQDD